MGCQHNHRKTINWFLIKRRPIPESYSILYMHRKKVISVVIRSPDSDIFHILLYYSNQFTIPVLFDSGTKDRRKAWNWTDIGRNLGPDYCEAHIGLMVYTAENGNCGFNGKGKIRPLAITLKKLYISQLSMISTSRGIYRHMLCRIWRPSPA